MGEIYKITNNINKKVYIGKTKRDTKIRWLEHIRDAKNYPEKNIPLHKAILKYGKDKFSFEILETDIAENDLNEKEKMYIKQYNSTNSLIGYNATKGGDGGFVHSTLSINDVNKIKNMLLDGRNNKSFYKIAQDFNVTFTAIKSINNGTTWYEQRLDYPLRKYDSKTTSIDREIYKDVVKELISTNTPLNEIASKYKISINTICSINQGKHCYDGNNIYYNDIYSGSFPIRQTNVKIECDFNKAFYEVLFTSKSISQIERDFQIHFNGLRYIVLGTRRKELTEQYFLPMRKHLKENQNIWLKINGGCDCEVCTD